MFVPGIGVSNGLRIVYDIGRHHDKAELLDNEKLDEVSVFIHHPGVVPDPSAEVDLITKLKVGQKSVIVLDAKVVNVTQAFASLPLDQRQCKMPDESEDEIACDVDYKMKLASETCSCVPWYIKEDQAGTSKNKSWMSLPSCNLLGNICFRRLYASTRARNRKTRAICRKSCIDTYYTSQSVDAKDLDRYKANSAFFVTKEKNRGSLFRTKKINTKSNLYDYIIDPDSLLSPQTRQV